MSTGTLQPDWETVENEDIEALRQQMFVRFMRGLRKEQLRQNAEETVVKTFVTKGSGHASSGHRG